MKTIDDEQRYRDRTEAGRLLAARLREQFEPHDAVIVALARGGVPVGSALAREFGVGFEVLVVGKLGLPSRPECALGAIASGGSEVLNHALIQRMGLSHLHVAAVADRALNELRRRETLYGLDERSLDLRHRTVVLVDDGVATGATMRAAIHAARLAHADRIVVAVPVGDSRACEQLQAEVDLLICPFRPDPFYTVNLWYRDYRPFTDEEVRQRIVTAGDSAGESPR